jgi:hypothetical protein
MGQGAQSVALADAKKVNVEIVSPPLSTANSPRNRRSVTFDDLIGQAKAVDFGRNRRFW